VALERVRGTAWRLEHMARIVKEGAATPSNSPVARVYTQIMKWLFGFLLMVALLLSGYAVYKARRLESATKPQIHPIASAFAP
jgi:hypothetical protein